MLTQTSSGRRCVCGRSQALPLCDGSHHSDAWSCLDEREEATLLVASSPSLMSFAERLAHSLGGQVAHKSSQLSARRVIRLVDAQVPRPAPHLSAERALTLVVDAPLELIAAQLPEGEGVAVAEGEEPHQLWRSIKSLSKDPAQWEPKSPWVRAQALPRVFISHAIADEPLLMPVIRRLRDSYKLEVFVCVDSLEAGGRWREELQVALEGTDLVIIALSEALTRSTFCAYEVGLAHGRGIPTLSLSLDGVTPPLYMSHLQTLDLLRQRAIRPWLSEGELLLQLTLELIHQVIQH